MRTTSQRATARRWWMLLLLSLGFVELTLNWFDIASAFPALSQQFRLQIPQLALLISVFIAGYAIFHIPTGFLAYRFGVRNILLAGLLLESLGSIAIAFAPDYTWLVVLRFVTGIGGSFFVGCGFSMVTSWFRGRELALAMGIAGGGAFALGSALGLFAWVGIVQSTSWPVALVIGGVAGLVVFLLSLLFLRAPNDEAARLNTHHFSWSAVGRVLGNRDLWFLGLCFFGIYGAGLTLDQLISEYVGIVYHVPAATGGLMAAVLTLMAVPGSIIGGFLSDRVKRLKPVIVIPWIIMGLGFIVLPFVNVSGIWVLIVVMGAASLVGFAGWGAAPGHYKDRVFPEDIATATGLMLTIAGVGGFAVSAVFGQIASNGFTPAWIFGGVVGIVFALFGLLAREPLGVTARVGKVAEVASAEQPITG